MSTQNPPIFFTDIFNSSFYNDVSASSGISQSEADNRYLIKIQPDSSASLQAFAGGIDLLTSSIDTIGGNYTTNSGDINTNLGTLRGRFLNVGLTSTLNNINATGLIYTTNELKSRSLTIETAGLVPYASINQIDGLSISNIKTLTDTDQGNIMTNTNGVINIGTLEGRTNDINIGANSSNYIKFGGLLTARVDPSTSTATFTNINTQKIDCASGALAFNLATNASSGALNIGNAVARTGDVNILTTQTTGTADINIGSLLVTGSQNITINRPLTVGYVSVPSSINMIGGSAQITGSNFTIDSNTKTLTSLTVGVGVYAVHYKIQHTITVAPITFTFQRIILCDTEDAVNSQLDKIESLETAVTTRPLGSFSIAGSGLWKNTVPSTTAYLNIKYAVQSGTGVLKASGYLRLVRIA